MIVPVPDLSYTGRRGQPSRVEPLDGFEGEADEAAQERDDGAEAEPLPPAQVDAWEAARARLALARRLQARLDAGEYPTHRALADALRVSSSRVNQLILLLSLDPSILAVIEKDRAATVALGDETLRRLARMKDPKAQVEAFRNALATVRGRGRKPLGFRHIFERARRFQAILDAEPDLTLKALGEREGLTGMRVGQIVLFLSLAPEIIAALDVPGEKLPVGITEQSMRPILRIRDHREQVEAFMALLRAGR